VAVEIRLESVLNVPMDTSNWYECLDADSKHNFQAILESNGAVMVYFTSFIVGKPTLDLTLPHTFAVEIPYSKQKKKIKHAKKRSRL
jgi:hypothetical protein